ncbi:hypothetical protein ATM97_27815 [Nocardia sp. MH4]|nr:hypothetical protein [Nocardia sp. MH4]
MTVRTTESVSVDPTTGSVVWNPATDITPSAEVVRERFLDAVFTASATIGAALGISGRAMYEILAPLADDAAAACVAAATTGGAE